MTESSHVTRSKISRVFHACPGIIAQYAVGSNKDMSKSSRILAEPPGAERGCQSQYLVAVRVHFSHCYLLPLEYWTAQDQANHRDHTSLRDNVFMLTASWLQKRPMLNIAGQCHLNFPQKTRHLYCLLRERGVQDLQPQHWLQNELYACSSELRKNLPLQIQFCKRDKRMIWRYPVSTDLGHAAE